MNIPRGREGFTEAPYTGPLGVTRREFVFVPSPPDGALKRAEVVRTLIVARAPLDHVNNLGWTALIESIVLGDGGARHLATLQALVGAGADVNLADRTGRTPLHLAEANGYREMAQVLRAAGAR